MRVVIYYSKHDKIQMSNIYSISFNDILISDYCVNAIINKYHVIS